MDDKHFDKTLKDILNNPPLFEPAPQAISDMRDRLDKAMAPRRKRVGLLWWLIPLLSLPFLFSSIFFYNKYKNANQTAYDLKLQLSEFQKDTNENIEHHTTYFFDTIYNTIYRDVIVERNIKSKDEAANANYYANAGIGTYNNRPFLVPSQNVDLWTKNAQLPFANILSKNHSISSFGEKSPFGSKDVSLNDLSAILSLSSKLIEKLNEESPEEVRERDKQIQGIAYATIQPIYSWRKPVLSKAFENLPEPKLVEPKRDINPLLYFVPTGLQVGAHFNPITLASGLPGSDNSASTFGISANIKFVKNVALKVGLDKLDIGFKIYPEEDDFNTYPAAIPDNPDDILKELKGQFSYLQVPVQFRYLFGKEKGVRPFIGIGMIARKPIKQQFLTEYDTQGGDEYYKPVKIGNSGFDVKNLHGSIGVEYNFWKSFYAVAEGYYHHSFEQPQDAYFKLRYFGLDLGLKYEF